jgi:HK97 family phage prohead protease
MGSKKTYTFYTDKVSYKSEVKDNKKTCYISGYISTKDRDIVDDIVTEKAMSKMLSQLLTKSIKLDVEHEAWAMENPSIIPIGKIIEASRDEKGIFVKASINGSHSRFDEVWSSIKDGYLDAFSIAYKANDYVHKLVDGVKTRMLNDVDLLNVAITGNPVNPEARMTNVFTKSLNEFTEENKMSEEVKTPLDEISTEEKPVEEAKEEVEEAPEAEVAEEPAAEAEEASEEAPDVEVKALMDETKSLKAKLKSMDAEIKNRDEKITELKAENEEQKEQLEKDIIKEGDDSSLEKAEVEQKAVEASKNPLDLI